MFLSSTPEEAATGDLAEIYARERGSWGYLPNYAPLFGHRPQVWHGWRELLASVRDHMDRRLYELATVAAATALKSSYCALAHGKALTNFYQPQEVAELVQDPARLPEGEAEVMRFAALVASDASAVTAADVEALRSQGYTDADIFDIAAAAAARAFFAKLTDALGVEPDWQLGELPVEMVKVLTVGRPIAEPA
ncbi:MAG TPA: peroxidase [Acidimicrobiia bacterium]|nr:peroxidase [Acidimicrobiia bacterium]